jgi:hypothetical protein
MTEPETHREGATFLMELLLTKFSAPLMAFGRTIGV